MVSSNLTSFEGWPILIECPSLIVSPNGLCILRGVQCLGEGRYFFPIIIFFSSDSSQPLGKFLSFSEDLKPFKGIRRPKGKVQKTNLENTLWKE